MDSQHEKLVTAYLDGELSAAEAAELDKSLTPGEKTNLSSEIRLERAIGERLSRGAVCPDEVWQRTLAAIEKQTSPVQRFAPRGSWVYGATALAAMLALTAAGLFLNARLTNSGPSVLAIAKGTTVQMLQDETTFRNMDTESVNAYFKEHGFKVAMTNADVQIPGDHHTPRVLLGLRPVANHGDDVMELMFNCCDRPLKVVVAKMGSRTAREIGDLMAEGKIQESRRVGGYVAALVGKHETHGLLEYLTDEVSA